MDWSPCLTRSGVGAELRAITLGHPLLDDYLAFVGARARPNTWLATAHDPKVFFTVVAKEPAQVTTADVFAFIAAQRSPRGDPKVVRLEDGESGLAARTIKRRLASVSGLFAYLVARGDVGMAANPVPRGLATRRAQTRPGARGVALIRSPRTLPRVLWPDEVDRFMAALRTRRDRAMAKAMVLAPCAAARCLVCGLATCTRASVACSSPRARAATSATGNHPDSETGAGFGHGRTTPLHNPSGRSDQGPLPCGGCCTVASSW